MRHNLLIAAMAVSLTGCKAAKMPPADGYKRLQDSAAVALFFPTLFYMPCYERSGPNERRFIGAAKCYKFNGSEHVRGVWTIGFEANSFEPTSRRTGWYRLAGNTLPWKQLHCGVTACRFKVDFIGRQTRYPMVGRGYVFLVDRLLSMKPIYAERHPQKPNIWIAPGGESPLPAKGGG